MYARPSIDQEVEVILNSVGNFMSICLEDVKAPRCFELEQKLKNHERLPVLHDDQHASAVAMLAAIINALKVAKK